MRERIGELALYFNVYCDIVIDTCFRWQFFCYLLPWSYAVVAWFIDHVESNSGQLQNVSKMNSF